MSTDKAMVTDCDCTKVAQDETCPVGYPSLLCEVCDGKGVVPAALAQAEQPVAYLSGIYREFIEGRRDRVPLGAEVSFLNLNWPGQIPLYAHPPAKREAGETAASGAPAPESHLDTHEEFLEAFEEFNAENKRRQAELAATPTNEAPFEYCDGCDGHNCDREKGCAYPDPAPVQHLRGSALEALRRAERFMAGFEGDEMQEGIDADLAAIREAIEQAEAS